MNTVLKKSSSTKKRGEEMRQERYEDKPSSDDSGDGRVNSQNDDRGNHCFVVVLLRMNRTGLLSC